MIYSTLKGAKIMSVISRNYKKISIKDYLLNFVYEEENSSDSSGGKTITEELKLNGKTFIKFINEYWTSKQRKGNSLHEISYRACFKSELPQFFIKLLTRPGDIVYDPFSGRGTTVIEAGRLNRNIIGNDINPLSKILSYPRLFIPELSELKERLDMIPIDETKKAEIDLSMFYHPKTEAELVSIRDYLNEKKHINQEDEITSWIRMIATNKLTGHSKGFFSVYTLPPNQAASQNRQIKINKERNQVPEYKDTKQIILDKTESLLKDVTQKQIEILKKIALKAIFLTKDARYTDEIKDNSVQLTVTSPPFLNIVQYSNDNWLRCWFNSINAKEIEKNITMSRKIKDWCNVMEKVIEELYRITKPHGYVAFEVGEVQGGKVKLEEYVIPLGLKAGFFCEGIMINQQEFTKTANIWGISNNEKGTNTNRIVIFKKK